MAGKILDSDRDILEGLGIDPDTLGRANAPVNVSLEDSDIYLTLKNLPSGSRYYRSQSGFPISIKAMPLKVEDAIALQAMQDSENHEVIDDVFRKRVRGVPPEELLEMDRKYILAWMREQTFLKAPLRRTFTCESCGHLNHHAHIPLNAFVTYRLPDDVNEPEFDLPESGKHVKMRFERRRDILNVKEYVKQFEGYRVITPTDTKHFRIAASIVGKSIETALEFMADLSVIDFSVLSTQFDKCNMGMTEIAAVECGKGECGHINLIHIPFRGEFFIPRLRPDLVDEGQSVPV
jgi:hypothetical protein